VVILFVLCISLLELQRMQQISVVYFLYLFIFSGLEFTLTFLTHNQFDFNRYVLCSIFHALFYFLSQFSIKLQLCGVHVLFFSNYNFY